MIGRRLRTLCVVPVVVVAALAASHTSGNAHAATQWASGYCVYVSPGPSVPWGGATVCTP